MQCSIKTHTQCIWFCSNIGEYFWKAYIMPISNAYISNKKYLSAFIFSIRWGCSSFLFWPPTKVFLFFFFFFFEWKTNISFHQFSPECGALGTKFPCLLLLSIVSMLESHLPFKTNSNYASIKSEPFLWFKAKRFSYKDWKWYKIENPCCIFIHTTVLKKMLH